MSFNNKVCQLLNFTDITHLDRLKKVEEKSRLLSTLSTSVHHEMIGPIKSNIDFSERLIRNTNDPQVKETA